MISDDSTAMKEAQQAEKNVQWDVENYNGR